MWVNLWDLEPFYVLFICFTHSGGTKADVVRFVYVQSYVYVRLSIALRVRILSNQMMSIEWAKPFAAKLGANWVMTMLFLHGAN